jgi:chitinase
MTVEQLEERNKNTWGWAGCSYLQPGQVICLSTGSPPMPAPLANAVCGPQVRRTPKPSGMTELASLNPCPLKACCNVWGQCGTTKDFCIKAPADTGAPGTTKPGANSCTYNCGMDVVNNGSPPSSFIKLGYFEAFNPSRPCLHMRPGQITGYTHVHYAFGGISTSFDVDMSGQETIFQEFKALTGAKRIMSFGGWSFSTEGDTFPIFRQGVTAAQRDTFARNVVKFLTDNNLDGLDFDWVSRHKLCATHTLTLGFIVAGIPRCS